MLKITKIITYTALVFIIGVFYVSLSKNSNYDTKNLIGEKIPQAKLKSFDGIDGSNIAKTAGYSITVGRKDSGGSVISGTTDDFYTFTVDTNTATTGGISGGGEFCTSGPATLES